MRLPLRPGRLIAVTARRPVQPGRTRFAAAGMWSTRHVDAQEATVQGAPLPGVPRFFCRTEEVSDHIATTAGKHYISRLW